MQYKIPTRKKESHKGECGKILIIGGSNQYYGAPILSGLGAENAGADLISLMLPFEHIEAVKEHSLNFFLIPYSKGYLSLDDVEKILSIAKGNHVLVMGPGLGIAPETQEAVLEILKNIEIPAVLDAQALFPAILDIKRCSEWVVTPHKQEFFRLFGCKAELENVKLMAQKHKLNILVKGHVDIIAGSDGRIVENKTGCPEMRVGGTGDTLSGIIGSWIAQNVSVFDSSVSAAYYFGLCGENFKTKRKWFSARELIKFFPEFMSKEYSHIMNSEVTKNVS